MKNTTHRISANGVMAVLLAIAVMMIIANEVKRHGAGQYLFDSGYTTSDYRMLNNIKPDKLYMMRDNTIMELTGFHIEGSACKHYINYDHEITVTVTRVYEEDIFCNLTPKDKSDGTNDPYAD